MTQFKYAKFRFSMVVVLLRMVPRSNSSFGTEVLVRTIIWHISPELITIFTCIPMGDVLISGDLYVGHNVLGQPMLVDPTEVNNNTPKTA